MLQLLHRCVGLFAISYEAWAVNLCLRAKLSLHIGSALIINSLILFLPDTVPGEICRLDRSASPTIRFHFEVVSIMKVNNL